MTTSSSDPVFVQDVQQILAVGFDHIRTGPNTVVLEQRSPGVTYTAVNNNATIDYRTLFFEPFIGRGFFEDLVIEPEYEARENGQGVAVDLSRGTARLSYTYSGVFDAEGNEIIRSFDARDSLININNVQGSERPDTLTGNGNANDLRGNRGADIIQGLGGSDTLYGGGGRDTILGGSGADQIFGNASNDDIRGGRSNDLLHGGQGNDTIEGGLGDDTIDGVSDGLFITNSRFSGSGEVDIFTQTQQVQQRDDDGNVLTDEAGNILTEPARNFADVDRYILGNGSAGAYYQGNGDNDRAEIREFDNNDTLFIAPGIDHILTRTENGFNLSTVVNGSTDLVARVTTVGNFVIPEGFNAVGTTATFNLNGFQDAKFTEDGHDFLTGNFGGVSGGDTADVLLVPRVKVNGAVTGTESAEIFEVSGASSPIIINFQDGIDRIDVSQAGITSFEDFSSSGNFVSSGLSFGSGQSTLVNQTANHVGNSNITVIAYGDNLTGNQTFLDSSDFIFA